MRNEKAGSLALKEARGFGFRLKLDLHRNWELYLIFLPVLLYYIILNNPDGLSVDAALANYALPHVKGPCSLVQDQEYMSEHIVHTVLLKDSLALLCGLGNIDTEIKSILVGFGDFALKGCVRCSGLSGA